MSKKTAKRKVSNYETTKIKADELYTDDLYDESIDNNEDESLSDDTTVDDLTSVSSRFSRLARISNSDDDDDDVRDIEFDNVEDMDELDDELQSQKEDSSLDPQKFGLSDTKAKNIYCNNAELVEEIRKYQEENIATEKLGELLIKIGVHMTSMVRFWRYSIAIKEELAQNAIMQMMKSVPKFNLKKENPNAFGYMSMIAYRDMLHTLKRHFKQDNFRDEIAGVYISRLSERNTSDERIGMLRHTLQKSEEFNKFLKTDKYPYQKKEVDMFALSRKEQSRRHKETLRRQTETTTKRRRRVQG